MQAYVEGDTEAFQRLFDALAPAVHAFLARTVRDAAVGDDLTQTTFLKVHASRRQWRRGNGVRPWILAIAAHVRADWLRSRGRDATEPYDDEAMSAAGSSEDPGAAAGHRERGERVRAALESLTEPQRVVVHLHRFEGLGFAEIGTILGISEGAAKLRAFRAYEELRRRLGDLGEEETP
jgi:RNA polymerase sigma factor (sigma-70 family)